MFRSVAFSLLYSSIVTDRQNRGHFWCDYRPRIYGIWYMLLQIPIDFQSRVKSLKTSRSSCKVNNGARSRHDVCAKNHSSICMPFFWDDSRQCHVRRWGLLYLVFLDKYWDRSHNMSVLCEFDRFQLRCAAPFKDVCRAVSCGTLGSLNPTPWAAMTGNCCGWVAYSYLIQVSVSLLFTSFR